jgi:hypothetical protein
MQTKKRAKVFLGHSSFFLFVIFETSSFLVSDQEFFDAEDETVPNSDQPSVISFSASEVVVHQREMVADRAETHTPFSSALELPSVPFYAEQWHFSVPESERRIWAQTIQADSRKQQSQEYRNRLKRPFSTAYANFGGTPRRVLHDDGPGAPRPELLLSHLLATSARASGVQLPPNLQGNTSRTQELSSLFALQMRGDLTTMIKENSDFDGNHFPVTNSVLNPKKD